MSKSQKMNYINSNKKFFIQPWSRNFKPTQVFLLLALLLFFFTAKHSVRAETIDFESVLKDAIENSFKLKKSDLEVKISKEERKTVRSEYFPTLKTGFNTQYDKDLTGGNSTITSVGDTVLLDRSRYQNSASISLNYTLFDFGVRKRKLAIANKDIEQKKVGYNKELRDLKLNLLDLYEEALINYKQLENIQNQLNIKKEIFNIQQSLFEQGKASKIQVANEALAVVKTDNELDNIKNKIGRTLKDISFYTHKDYELDKIQFLNINQQQEEQEEFVPVSLKEGNASTVHKIKIDYNVNLEETPEHKTYELEIAKKQKEIEILKRQRLPQFGFYTGYYFYGTHEKNYLRAFENLEDRTLSFRIFSQLPIFDGLKNRSQRNKIKLEIEKLKTEKQEKLYNIKKHFEKIKYEQELYEKELKNNEKSLSLAQDTFEMTKQLDDQRLIDKISFLRQKLALINQNLELDLSKTKNILAHYKLKVLSSND